MHPGFWQDPLVTQGIANYWVHKLNHVKPKCSSFTSASGETSWDQTCVLSVLIWEPTSWSNFNWRVTSKKFARSERYPAQWRQSRGHPCMPMCAHWKANFRQLVHVSLNKTNVGPNWPKVQGDHLMSCQSREKPGSCPKQKSTIMRTPGYGSKMIHPLGYRMIRIMIYASLTCHS